MRFGMLPNSRGGAQVPALAAPTALGVPKRTADSHSHALSGTLRAMPLALPLDAHLHTDLSPDADVPLDAYAALARGLGVAELAITDHVDFVAGDPAYRFADYDRRVRMVREAAERGRAIPRFGSASRSATSAPSKTRSPSIFRATPTTT